MCQRQLENGKSFYFLVCLRLKTRPKAKKNDVHKYGDWWRLDEKKKEIVGLFVCSFAQDEEINGNVTI